MIINLRINFLVTYSYIDIYKAIASAKSDEKSVRNQSAILYGKPNILEPVRSYDLKGRITHFFGAELFFLKPEKNAGRK